MICPECGRSNAESALVCAACEWEFNQRPSSATSPGKEVHMKKTVRYSGVRRVVMSLVLAFVLVLIMLMVIISMQSG